MTFCWEALKLSCGVQFKVKGSSFLGLSTVVVLVFRVMFAGLWFEA